VRRKAGVGITLTKSLYAEVNMKRTIFTSIAIACMTLSAMADDLKITFDTSSKAMNMTQKSTQVHYYSSKFVRVNDEKEKTDTLLDYKDFVFYQIDHKKKNIGFFKLDDMTEMMKLLSAKSAQNGKEMNDIMKMFGGDYSNAKLSVVKGGNKVVAGRNCTQWTISYGKMVNKISSDPKLEPPIPADAYAKANKLKDAVAMMAVPGLGDGLTKIIDEIAKIKGVHLESENTIPMGPITSTATSKATKIVEGPIPASVFELPKGYKKEDLGKKMLEELRKNR
jgi:hypothetical protein